MKQFIRPLVLPFVRGIGAQWGGAMLTLRNDLVAYWKLDETSDGSGAVTRVDSKGTHNATDISPYAASGTGKNNACLVLAEANAEYLTVADHANLQGGNRSFSFDMWIKPTTIIGVHSILSKGVNDSSPANYEYFIFQSSATIGARFSNGTTYTSIATGNVLTAGTWHYLAFGYDANNDMGWVQVDANLPAVEGLTGGVTTTSGLLYIGKKMGAASYFDGSIDEIARWNKYLTTAERAARYNGGSGMFYPFPPNAGFSGVNSQGFEWYSSTID